MYNKKKYEKYLEYWTNPEKCKGSVIPEPYKKATISYNNYCIKRKYRCYEKGNALYKWVCRSYTKYNANHISDLEERDYIIYSQDHPFLYKLREKTIHAFFKFLTYIMYISYLSILGIGFFYAFAIKDYNFLVSLLLGFLGMAIYMTLANTFDFIGEIFGNISALFTSFEISFLYHSYRYKITSIFEINTLSISEQKDVYLFYICCALLWLIYWNYYFYKSNKWEEFHQLANTLYICKFINKCLQKIRYNYIQKQEAIYQKDLEYPETFQHIKYEKE